MTAPRLARAGRIRFFIGIASLILMVGFVAIFHSSQTQLEDSKQIIRKCEQQQDAQSARIQDMLEHKSKLENMLNNERKDYSESKKSFEQKFKEQKDIHSKSSMDLNVRFESMQNQYKKLQGEHSDLELECSKTKGSQSEQINGLERKVKALQSQLQLTKTQLEKQGEEWKLKYENLHQEMEKLKSTQSSNNSDKCRSYVSTLEAQLTKFKSNCNYRPEPDSNKKNVLKSSSKLKPNNGFSHPLDKPAVQKSFKEQQLIAQKPIISPNEEGKVKPSVSTPLNALSVANSPTPAGEKIKRSSSLKAKHMQLGVAPVPENVEALLENVDESNKIGDLVANNRYVNAVNDEHDTGAHEEKDTDFNIGLNDEGANEGKDNLRQVLENLNNPAEDDNNFFDAKPAPDGHKKDHGELEDDGMEIEGANRDKNEGGEAGHNLNDEVVGDQGKEPAFEADMQIIENEEDEDGKY